MDEKTKSKKLLDKCVVLANKIENEKSRAKRTLYSIKMKMLIAKIERELDIRDLQEEYAMDREERMENLQEEKSDARTESIKISKKIKALKKALKENKEYDYSSKDFIFPKEEVETEGGIDRYIGILRTSGNREQEEVATDIQETLAKRRELERLQKELQETKEQLKNADKMARRDNRKSKVTETALVTAKKANIFQKIGSFFRNLGSTVIETKEEISDLNALNMEKKDNIKSIKKEAKMTVQEQKEAFEEAKQKAYEEYQAKIQQLQEEYEQESLEQKENTTLAREVTKEMYSDRRKETIEQHKSERVRAFKEKYQELAQRAGETGEMPSSTSPEEVIHVQGEVIDDGYEIGDD